ncbi:hypothetical protein KJ639_00400 [Patescibacteria group bacterium]|nr:hypothetical protein [Patescibacteria group bacterium]
MEISFVATEENGEISVFVIDAENDEDARKLLQDVNVLSFLKHESGDKPESGLVQSLFYIDKTRDELETLLTKVFLAGRDYGIELTKKKICEHLFKNLTALAHERAQKNLEKERGSED